MHRVPLSLCVNNSAKVIQMGGKRQEVPSKTPGEIGEGNTGVT